MAKKYSRQRQVKAPPPLINRNIKTENVRLVDEEKQTQEVVPFEDALKIAEDAGLDLVVISANSNPPVCKILDYSHYIYNKNKMAKLAKKSNKVNTTKELKLSPKMGEHDYQVRYRAAVKFLTKGYKVKVTLFFRGREITHPELGLAHLKRMVEDLNGVGTVEQAPILSGKIASMMLLPQK